MVPGARFSRVAPRFYGHAAPVHTAVLLTRLTRASLDRATRPTLHGRARQHSCSFDAPSPQGSSIQLLYRRAFTARLVNTVLVRRRLTARLVDTVTLSMRLQRKARRESPSKMSVSKSRMLGDIWLAVSVAGAGQWTIRRRRQLSERRGPTEKCATRPTRLYHRACRKCHVDGRGSLTT